MLRNICKILMNQVVYGKECGVVDFQRIAGRADTQHPGCWVFALSKLCNKGTTVKFLKWNHAWLWKDSARCLLQRFSGLLAAALVVAPKPKSHNKWSPARPSRSLLAYKCPGSYVVAMARMFLNKSSGFAERCFVKARSTGQDSAASIESVVFQLREGAFQ